MTATGTVAWFDLTKQFGFVALSNGYGDASLHMSVLKEAGYVSVSRGTTVRVRVEEDRGKQWVVEVFEIDPSSARSLANEPILRKPTACYDLNPLHLEAFCSSCLRRSHADGHAMGHAGAAGGTVPSEG